MRPGMLSSASSERRRPSPRMLESYWIRSSKSLPGNGTEATRKRGLGCTEIMGHIGSLTGNT